MNQKVLAPIFKIYGHSGPSASTSTSTPMPPSVQFSPVPSTLEAQLDTLTSQLHPPSQTSFPGQHLTRTEALFASATGLLPNALKISNDNHLEFYLFMDLRAERQWISYAMTPRKWIEATSAYNIGLKVLVDSEKLKGPFVPKTPHALMDALGDVEPKILAKLSSGKYECKSTRN